MTNFELAPYIQSGCCHALSNVRAHVVSDVADIHFPARTVGAERARAARHARLHYQAPSGVSGRIARQEGQNPVSIS